MDEKEQLFSWNLPEYRARFKAANGRKPTALEEGQFKRGRSAWKKAREPNLDRLRKERERKEWRIVETVHPSEESLARRAILEADLLKWSEYYFADILYDESGQIHIDACRELQYRLENGGRKAKCLPRGSGKSVIGETGCMWAALTGKRKFIVPIGSTVDNAQSYHDFVVTALTQNERIHEDYPEVTTFFHALEGSAHKAKYQIDEREESTGIRLKPKFIVLPNCKDKDGKPYPAAMCVIAIKSIDSRFRGTKYVRIDGREVRPDFVLLDDIQDEETAASDVLSQKMEKKVVGAVLGLAGPRSKIACYFACTIQRPGDVSWLFLDRDRHPDFSGDNIPLFISWPKDHAERGGLWQGYEEIWRDTGAEDETRQARLNKYLQDNWKAMHEGAVTSWPTRVREGELSAIQTGMNLWLENGDQFFSEYQGAPVKEGVNLYDISPETVLKRTTSRAPFELPEWNELITAATDINPSKALTTVVKSWGRDATNATIYYDRFEDSPLPTNNDMSDTQKGQIIYEALQRVGERLLQLPVKAKAWGIDGGGAQSNTARRFAYEWNRMHPEMQVVVMYGRGSKKELGSARNKDIRRVGRDESWLLKRGRDTQFGLIEWVLWSADYWRDIMLRSWTCESGAPGGSTLPRGNHHLFASHICSEKLEWKGDQNGVTGYRYSAKHGDNDYADACNMCHVLADMQGIGSVGVQKQKAVFVPPIYRPSSRR
jgi:hypothetical protein